MSGWTNSDRRSRLPADWAARRRQVLDRDRRLCRIRYPDICATVAVDVDHITAGDNHDLTNLQAACRPCHKHKTNLESQQARGVGVLRRRPAEAHPGLLDGGGG